MRCVFQVAGGALLVTFAGCGQVADDVAQEPDAAADVTSPEAASDANACMSDSTQLVCCCDGDVGGIVTCDGDGSYVCAPGLKLYFGTDCTRPCGPCSIACPDTGTVESGAD